MSDKLVFDSQEWRVIRNQKLKEWLKDDCAIDFLLDVFHVAEVWDDLIDKDKHLSNADIHKAFYTALITLPNNPFFVAYTKELTGVMTSGIHAWIDATSLETGNENEKIYAYVLRDWYMELLTLVCTLLHGFDYTHSISLEMRHFFINDDFKEFKEQL